MKEINLDDETIIRYKPLVEKIAKKMYFQYLNLELDDLISYGYLGLIDAIKRYKVDKKVQFEAYASIRIRGSIIDGIRADGKMSRTDAPLIKKMDEYKIIYQQKYNRKPTREELASLLHLSLTQLKNLERRIEIFNAMSIDSFDFDIKHYDKNFDIAERFELNRFIEELCSVLSERQKKFLHLYYGNNLTEKEIATIFGITPTGVSQMKINTLKKLRRNKNNEKLRDYL